MATLLLQLIGPMQSWGTQSHFTHRDAGLEPSKSGVIGLICASMGLDRSANIEHLAALRMGVRIDREGIVKRDYHTSGRSGFLRANGDIERNNVIVSERYYLSDAAFLVGLEGDPHLLQTIHECLRRPVWMLYLGRKSFVSSEPVWIKDGALRVADTLEMALMGERCHRRIAPQQAGFDSNRARVVIEDDALGEVRGAIVRNDQPITFERKGMHQHCTIRRVRVEWHALKEIA